MNRLSVALAGCGLFLTVFGMTIFGFAMAADPLQADARMFANYLSSACVMGGIALMTLSGIPQKQEPVEIRRREITIRR